MTAALPGAEVTGARVLTADGDGRFDSAVASLRDGRELTIRVAEDDEAATELSAEALALRALTPGARAMLPFDAPTYVGETRVGDARALVTELLPGFQIEAEHVPGGRGAAESMGAALAAVHALPVSVVRGAGLPARSAAEVREEIGRLVDDAAATGRVPARLTVRWREAVADDDLWRFESTVVLGSVQSTSFVFDDDSELGPRVTGLLGWHGLSVGDPATDLSWLSAAPDAAADVQAAYARASERTPDAAIEARARLLAELEFARWLVHGDSLRRSDIVDDAAALLESLAAGLGGDVLSADAPRSDGVDSALAALDRVPVQVSPGIDTSMQTDAYNPDDLWHQETEGFDPADISHRLAAGGLETEDLSGVRDDEVAGSDSSDRIIESGTGSASNSDASDLRSSEAAAADDEGSPEEEAQRAARAALQRWKSSDSE